MISAFRVRPAGGDFVISMDYYSELLNHVPENLEVLAREKYTNNLAFLIIIGIFSPYQDFHFFDT